MIVRPEADGDQSQIYAVQREAFANAGGSGAEAALVSALRDQHAIVVSMVAVHQHTMLGHAAFSTVVVRSAAQRVQAVALGPVAVVPAHQKQGIGAMLIRAGLAECKRLGHRAVFVLGHPDYYPRFGFRPALEFDIGCEFIVPDEAFMAIELSPGALTSLCGTVHYHPAFQSV